MIQDALPEWKQRLKETLPDVATLLENEAELFEEDYTIYNTFFEVSLLCDRLHKDGDPQDELLRIYAFAEWCNFHKEKDLWNAVGVAFYEHLIDEPETLEAMPRYVSREVFINVRGLLKCRMEAEAFATLCNRFGISDPTGEIDLAQPAYGLMTPDDYAI